MRVIFTLLWTLPLLWLCSVHSAEKLPPRPAAVVQKTGVAKGWPQTVLGLGITVDAAKDDAFEQARRAIIAFLEKQQPPMRSWRPTRAEIEKYVVSGEPGPDIPLDKDGDAKSWKLTLRDPVLGELRTLDQTARVELEQQARKLRTQERVFLLGKVMVGAVAVLVLLLAGSRLTEKLQPRYAHLMLAGIIGIVACIVVGLFLV